MKLDFSFHDVFFMDMNRTRESFLETKSRLVLIIPVGRLGLQRII